MLDGRNDKIETVAQMVSLISDKSIGSPERENAQPHFRYIILALVHNSALKSSHHPPWSTLNELRKV